jgi:uncharacterized membrane protein YhaH (DUF805 family)
MTYRDLGNRPSEQPPARSEWWRHYMTLKSRQIAENRMRYFYVFGGLMILVAAIFLVPMLLS